MSDIFKDKLKRYEKGLLEGEELVEFEKELEKLELYQNVLEEEDGPSQLQGLPTKQKTNKILLWSKWKARFQTAFTALGILLIFIFVTTFLSGLYYTWGDPDRTDVFSDVIDQTMTISDPYGYLGGTSTSVDFFFRMNATRDISKKIGDERVKVGEMRIPFLFSSMGFPERNMYGTEGDYQATFMDPGTGDGGMSDWNRLSHLPEGTVVTAFISFNKLVDTETIFDHFSNKNFSIIWLALDTGGEGRDDDYGRMVIDPIGFPPFPIWHDDDMIQESYEEKGTFFNKTVSESYSSPEYEEGDTKVLHEQFMKTMKFLKKHEKMAGKLYTGMNLDVQERMDYLEGNGFKHYGVVVTGPTKEIAKLKKEPLIQTIEIDEVGFWNWNNE